MKRIDNSMYVGTYGKRPRGMGPWMFGTGTAAHELFSGRTPKAGIWIFFSSYTEARKSAARRAEEEGVTETVYVLT